MRWLGAVVQAAVMEMRAKRAAFLLELLVMAINDVVWVGFWLTFFGNTGTVRHWDSHHMLLLFSVLTVVVGLSNGLFTNARALADHAADGRMDSALTLPVHPLTFLLIRKFNASGVGDALFGVVLFAVVGRPRPVEILSFIAATALGAIILTGFLVVLSATALAFGARGRQAHVGFDVSILFASYPLSYFGLLLQGLLYSVIPAAFFAWVPVRFVNDPSLSDGALLIGVAAVFSVGGYVSFNAALRRYRSGSSWTSA